MLSIRNCYISRISDKPSTTAYHAFNVQLYPRNIPMRTAPIGQCRPLIFNAVLVIPTMWIENRLICFVRLNCFLVVSIVVVSSAEIVEPGYRSVVDTVPGCSRIFHRLTYCGTLFGFVPVELCHINVTYAWPFVEYSDEMAPICSYTKTQILAPIHTNTYRTLWIAKFYPRWSICHEDSKQP